MAKSKQQAVALGLELRRVRRALDLNQGELAKRARVCQASISRVENGAAITPAVTRRVLNALLGARARKTR
jgi:predicted transcriptional regulator